MTGPTHDEDAASRGAGSRALQRKGSTLETISSSQEVHEFCVDNVKQLLPVDRGDSAYDQQDDTTLRYRTKLAAKKCL